MAWLKGKPRFEVTLLRMVRLVSGRYSVRQPVESSGASAAVRAKPISGEGCGEGCRMGKSDSIFARYSPSFQSSPARVRRQEGGSCLAIMERVCAGRRI